MKKYEAAVFDLDGTLLDTLEDLTDSVNLALKDYGCPEKSIEQIREYVGCGIRNLMQRCVEGGESHPEFEAVFSAFRKYYRENCKNKTKPYDGVMEMLGALRADGVKIAIVSNKADFAVKELNDYYFKGLGLTAIGEREGVARKPAPDTVLEALRLLKAAPKKAVYIGDSEVDVETAANAKLPCISVLWGFRSKEILTAHGAKHFAESAGEILKLMEEI